MLVSWVWIESIIKRVGELQWTDGMLHPRLHRLVAKGYVPVNGLWAWSVVAQFLPILAFR